MEEIKKPVGIFTERDVVKVLGKLSPWLLRMPLRDLMSKPVLTVAQTSSVKDAMQIMSSKNIRRLVVVDNDQKMVGIITLKDILKLINSSPEMLSEFYGPNFPVKLTEMYERFTEYKFDSPRPGL
ncbi:MAG TPA: CBS domain-containing protein [Nitrososphaeraceae archaeon]